MNGQPQNHKEIIALIKRISGQANFIGTPRIYVDMFDGDLVAAVWFNQVVYWDGKTDNPIGFYKTYPEWKKELGLSRFQVNRAARLCEKRGLVNILFRKVYGTPKNHYLVVWPDLLKTLQATLNKPDSEETDSSLTDSSEGEGTEGSMEGEGTEGSLSIEEITSKSEILWRSIKDSIKKDMLRASFEEHILPARPVGIEDGWLLIAAKDEDSLGWMEDRLTTTIDHLLIGMAPDEEIGVRFVIAIEEPL